MMAKFLQTMKTDQTVVVQADLILIWAHMSKATFSYVVAHVITVPYLTHWRCNEFPTLYIGRFQFQF